MSKHLKILLLVIASVSVVSSCGKEDKSEWYVTSDGVGLSLEDGLSVICKRMSLDRMLKKTYAGAYFWNIRDMSESVKPYMTLIFRIGNLHQKKEIKSGPDYRYGKNTKPFLS